MPSHRRISVPSCALPGVKQRCKMVFMKPPLNLLEPVSKDLSDCSISAVWHRERHTSSLWTDVCSKNLLPGSLKRPGQSFCRRRLALGSLHGGPAARRVNKSPFRGCLKRSLASAIPPMQLRGAAPRAAKNLLPAAVWRSQTAAGRRFWGMRRACSPPHALPGVKRHRRNR
jgi:hypothetical protein